MLYYDIRWWARAILYKHYVTYNWFVAAGGGNRFLWEVPRHCYEDPEREGGGVWISASSQTTLTVPTFTSTIQAGITAK